MRSRSSSSARSQARAPGSRAAADSERHARRPRRRPPSSRRRRGRRGGGPRRAAIARSAARCPCACSPGAASSRSTFSPTTEKRKWPGSMMPAWIGPDRDLVHAVAFDAHERSSRRARCVRLPSREVAPQRKLPAGQAPWRSHGARRAPVGATAEQVASRACMRPRREAGRRGRDRTGQSPGKRQLEPAQALVERIRRESAKRRSAVAFVGAPERDQPPAGSRPAARARRATARRVRHGARRPAPSPRQAASSRSPRIVRHRHRAASPPGGTSRRGRAGCRGPSMSAEREVDEHRHERRRVRQAASPWYRRTPSAARGRRPRRTRRRARAAGTAWPTGARASPW